MSEQPKDDMHWEQYRKPKGGIMKKLFNKWILPVCLLLIIFIQPIHYYLKGNINPVFIVFVIALLPAALKGLEYKISKRLEQLLAILAVLGMIYVIWHTFF